MPLTSRQLDNIMRKSGQAFVPRDRMNYAVRVCETYLRKKLYRFEDRAALAAYNLLTSAYSDIREYALYTANNLRLSTVGNDAQSIVFRRSVGDYATRRLHDYGQQVAVLGYRYATTAYTAGWYGRLWMLTQASRGDKRVQVTRAPIAKAGLSVLQPGMTEAVQADMTLYDAMGSEWRDQFTMAVNSAIAKIKRVLMTTASQPASVLPIMQDVGQQLGINATPKQSAKGLYHAVQLPIRTAVMRSANQASAAVYINHTEMLLGAMWVTSPDERVCPVCSRLDGSIYVINSLVGIALLGLPPDGSHYGCRCTIIPLMLPYDSPDDPPDDSMDDWLLEWGLQDELSFFMDDSVLESTQL